MVYQFTFQAAGYKVSLFSTVSPTSVICCQFNRCEVIFHCFTLHFLIRENTVENIPLTQNDLKIWCNTYQNSNDSFQIHKKAILKFMDLPSAVPPSISPSLQSAPLSCVPLRDSHHNLTISPVSGFCPCVPQALGPHTLLSSNFTVSIFQRL